MADITYRLGNYESGEEEPMAAVAAGPATKPAVKPETYQPIYRLQGYGSFEEEGPAIAPSEPSAMRMGNIEGIQPEAERDPTKFMDVPREVAPEKPSLGRPYEPGDIAYLSQKKEFEPYYGYQVRKYSEMWYRALGIERPDTDEIPPTYDRSQLYGAGPSSYGQLKPGGYRELKKEGYAAAERAKGIVPPLNAQEKILDLGMDYGPQPERWRGETLGMERPQNVLEQPPDIFDVIKANAILTNHNTLALSDFFIDIADPAQQASIARVHNDILWAQSVLHEYGKSHGVAAMAGLSIVGGTYGLLGSPLEAAVLFNITHNIGRQISKRLGSSMAASVLKKYGEGAVGTALARIPIFVANFMVQSGLFAGKRELEWNKIGPRLAKEMGVDVKDLESEAIQHGIGAGILLGLGSIFTKNKTILMDAMPSKWNEAMNESYSKAYANIVNDKIENIITDFLQSKPKGHNYTAQDWQEFIIDKYANPEASLEGIQSIEQYTNQLKGTAKGTVEDTSVLNLKDRYEVKVDEGQASHNQDMPIKSEEQLGDEYNATVKDRVTKAETPTEAIGFLSRLILKMSNIGNATEKMLLNKLYKGLSREEAKILYKKSVDDAFNKAFFEALVGKDPEMFIGHFTDDVASNKFIQNTLDMNKMIIDGLRERGVAVSELEEGYIRQTHDKFKMLGINEQDWINYTYQRLDRNKSFKEIYDIHYINNRIEELTKNIENEESAIEIWQGRQKRIKGEIKQKEAEIKALRAKTDKTAAEKSTLRGQILQVRALRYSLQESPKRGVRTGAVQMVPEEAAKAEAELKSIREKIKNLRETKERTPEQRAELREEVNKAKELREKLYGKWEPGEKTGLQKALEEKREKRVILRQDLRDYIKVIREIRRTKAAPNPVLKLIEKEEQAALKALKKPAKTAQEKKDRAKGQMQAIRNIRKILKENNVGKVELSRHAEYRANIKLNLNLARKSIRSAKDVQRRMRKFYKGDKAKLAELEDMFTLDAKEFQDYADLLEKKANDATLKGRELKAWRDAAEAFRKEINDLAELQEEARLQGNLEKEYNSKIREHERNIERLKKESVKSTEKDKKAIEKEARQFEKEAEQLKKEKDDIENSIASIQGSIKTIKELRADLAKEAKAIAGQQHEPKIVELKQKIKDLRKQRDKVRDMQIQEVPDPNATPSELVKFYADKAETEMLRTDELDLLNNEIKNLKMLLDHYQEKIGGASGKQVTENKLRQQLRQEQRALARKQREFLREVRSAQSRRAIRDSRRQISEYNQEKLMLEENSKLTNKQKKAKAKEILSDTYRKITLEGGEGTVKIGGTGRYHKQRELHFKDFDSWNNYQQDFGHGMSALQATISHLQGSSKKLAALEMLGPNPQGLRNELGPIIENLGGQKLSYAARRQLELFEAVIDNIMEYQATSPIADSSMGIRVIDNMNAIAATDLLKNVARYGLMFEPMQTSFWAAEYGLTNKGIWSTQYEGVKNALKVMGALGRKGAELLRIIPKADQEEMTLLGFLYHNNNRYIQAAEQNMNLNQGVVKFSRKAGQIFGSDLMQEVGYVNASSIWTYRTGQMMREGIAWKALDPAYQRVLRRYGVSEAEWDSLLTNNKGMMDNYYAGTGKEDSIKARSFSAMKLFNEATTKEEAALGRKMYYAQNEFVRLASMQSDPMINRALKSMVGSKNPKSAIGQMANKVIEGFFVFGGYDAHLIAQLRQVGIESGNVMTPGISMWMKWAGTMYGASYLTNMMTDLLRGREIEHNPKTIARAVTTVGGIGLLSRTIWEAIEATIDDQKSVVGKGLDVGSKFTPLGINYFWNKGSNAAMAFNDFMGGDNARAMYHARKAVPFINWLPTDMIANRLLMDNIFYNLDSSAAYRSWLMESKQAAQMGSPFDPDNRPGGWVIDNAPNVLNR